MTVMSNKLLQCTAARSYFLVATMDLILCRDVKTERKKN